MCAVDWYECFSVVVCVYCDALCVLVWSVMVVFCVCVCVLCDKGGVCSDMVWCVQCVCEMVT